MSAGRAHFALFDTLNDSEAGLLLVELRTGRFTGASFEVLTVAESREPITTLGGVRVEPDAGGDTARRIALPGQGYRRRLESAPRGPTIGGDRGSFITFGAILAFA
jgi:hypothetical protein